MIGWFHGAKHGPESTASSHLGRWIGDGLGLLVLLAWLAAAPGASPADPPIVLGVPTSLGYVEGRESLDAVNLAVEEINDRGGVGVGPNRRSVRVASIDLNDADPLESGPVVLRRLESFLEQQRPDAILVGPFRSELLLAAMNLIADQRVPFLGTIAMTPAIEAKVLNDPRYGNIFRVGLNTRYMAGYLIDNMKLLREKFGFHRVFVMNQDVAWARGTTSQVIKLYFNRAGWEVLGQKNFPSDTADFSDGLAMARTTGAQVILVVFDAPQSGLLIRQWRQLEVPALLIGFVSGATGPGAWNSQEGRIDGALLLDYELGNLPSTRYPPATVFYETFRRRYGREIEAGHGPAPSYEAVYLWAAAVEKAGSLDPPAVVAALKSSDRQGAMGRLIFHQGHQIIFGRDPNQEALACLFQWSPEGRRLIVYPEALAESELVLPPFVKSAK